jgi:PRTRC genetic system ThiF family protein
MEHRIDPALLEKRVMVHLVGVGGNGAQMAACLARLDIAMRALGHPGGLHVMAFDADRVSEANVGRQLYSRADLGQYKSVVTVHRLNLFYGFDWEAVPARYEDRKEAGVSIDPDVVVSCVDTRAARRALHEALLGADNAPAYWLDLGNKEATAQVLLGEPRTKRRRAGDLRLPCITELFPELLDPSIPDDNTPSCSVRMSLASQGLFINDVVVRMGAQLLYEIFSQGRLRHHGVVMNLESKRCGPVEVDAAVWARYGFVPDAADSEAAQCEPQDQPAATPADA